MTLAAMILKLMWYKFPRVVIHLDPDGFKLSPQCERFFEKHKPSLILEDQTELKNEVLKKFSDRFGNYPTR